MKNYSEKNQVFHVEFSSFKYTSVRKREILVGRRGVRGDDGRECWWTRGSVVVEGSCICAVGWFYIDSWSGYVVADVRDSVG